MKLKRTLPLCLTLAACAGLAIGGTMAYYTDRAETKNTFTLSEGVNILLDEALVDENFVADETQRVTANTYNRIYPGAVLPKDPTVHVAEGTEPAFLRVKVTVQGAADWLTVYTGDPVDLQAGFDKLFNDVNADFTMADITVDGTDVVYTLLYGAEVTGGEDITVFESVNFSSAFTVETLTQYFGGTGASFNIDVVAEAVQSATFETAKAAFAAYDGVELEPEEGDEQPEEPGDEQPNEGI